MRRSFITPFDRGDIKDLIGTLDDSIDQMQKTAKAIPPVRGGQLRARDGRNGRQHRQDREADVEAVSRWVPCAKTRPG